MSTVSVMTEALNASHQILQIAINIHRSLIGTQAKSELYIGALEDVPNVDKYAFYIPDTSLAPKELPLAPLPSP